jgi:hypothetical protein
MITSIGAAGAAVALGGGVFGLAGSRVLGGDRQLFPEDVATLSPGDLREPSRIVADGQKRRAAAGIVAQTLALGVAGGLVFRLAAAPGVPTAIGALAGVAFAFGATFVGMGVYAKLGLAHRETVETVAHGGAVGSMEVLDGAVARDAGAIAESLASARGEEYDPATAYVLAAARNGATLADLRAWNGRAPVEDGDVFERRARELADEGILRLEDDRLEVTDRVAGASPDQLAAVADSVL